MRLPPAQMPARPGTTFLTTNRVEHPHGVKPAGCCAEECVNIPFVGRVCHCVLDLPICPG